LQILAIPRVSLRFAPCLARRSRHWRARSTAVSRFKGIGHLPADFSGHAARVAHGVLAKLLIALIAGHALAALYHQFIRKDGLLGRMGFGSR